tara:strand:- start:130 stop:315 length:186 start_codon:yes stop_codon:yes gene_type:complete
MYFGRIVLMRIPVSDSMGERLEQLDAVMLRKRLIRVIINLILWFIALKFLLNVNLSKSKFF